MFKIFLSYSHKDKEIAGELKKNFESYANIECFVAHDDIIPGSLWEQEILKNLQTCDFFMLLNTKNLLQSCWCQQEAGFVITRDIRIVPLIPDVGGKKPIGFYSKFQGFPIKLSDIEGSVKKWLIKEGVLNEENSIELEERISLFKTSDSFAKAEINTKALFEFKGLFSKLDIEQIINISSENEQILYCWGARKYLEPFFIENVKLISKEQLDKYLKAK